MDFEKLLEKIKNDITTEIGILGIGMGNLLGTITFLLLVILILGIIGLVHFW